MFTYNCKLHKFETTNSNIENNIGFIIIGISYDATLLYEKPFSNLQ